MLPAYIYIHTCTHTHIQTQWMMYWIVFALFQAVEVVTDTFIPWLDMMWGGGEGEKGDERRGGGKNRLY